MLGQHNQNRPSCDKDVAVINGSSSVLMIVVLRFLRIWKVLLLKAVGSLRLLYLFGAGALL
jgi:hypothetical protein